MGRHGCQFCAPAGSRTPATGGKAEGVGASAHPLGCSLFGSGGLLFLVVLEAAGEDVGKGNAFLFRFRRGSGVLGEVGGGRLLGGGGECEGRAAEHGEVELTAVLIGEAEEVVVALAGFLLGFEAPGARA